MAISASGESNAQIRIRGAEGNHTLVLIDGRRQNTAGSVTPNGFGETSNSFMPPMSAIERIEVIRDEPRYYYAPPRERVIVVREPERPYWRHDNGWHRGWRRRTRRRNAGSSLGTP